MSSVNKHTIVGSVGTINELKGSTEMPVLTFSVATSDYVGKGKGEPSKNGEASDYATTWHDVTCFGKTAESLSKRLGKGDKVYVDGPLMKETYAKKDGSGQGLSVRIKANTVTIITSKAGAGAAAQVPANTVLNDEIPF